MLQNGSWKAMTHLRCRLGWILAGAGLSVIASGQTAPSPLSAREVFLRAAQKPPDPNPATSTTSAPKTAPPKVPSQTTVTPPTQAQSPVPAPAQAPRTP